MQNKSNTINRLKKDNHLFPIFLKLENLRLLIVGGGNVALEKLHAVLYNSPATAIRLVSVTVNQEIRELAGSFEEVMQKPPKRFIRRLKSTIRPGKSASQLEASSAMAAVFRFA